MDIFADILIVASKSDLPLMQKYSDYTIIKGGSERQFSLQNALTQVKTDYVMVTDIARACVEKELIQDIYNSRDKADTIVPYLDVSDTVVFNGDTIDRDYTKLIQTPQLSKTKNLKRALDTDTIYTDDSSAIKASGGSVYLVKGSKSAHKITFEDDVRIVDCLKSPSKDKLVGIGYDIHAFEDNKQMMLCGVEIESRFGFKAHSDGDVAIHSVIDALLGASGLGDIGEFFPDNDPAYKGVDSKKLLKEIQQMIVSIGFEIVNVDITIFLQKPKLLRYKTLMRDQMASLLCIDKRFVNIKATTGEKMGYIGRSEGAAVQSICSLRYHDWTQK
jgi:2-C-methyl-D-erythritol 4-phosphate cytidylyltransferase/2-C-methyl-D-erythritol 2,4-cyclodiphosphate synthase